MPISTRCILIVTLGWEVPAVQQPNWIREVLEMSGCWSSKENFVYVSEAELRQQKSQKNPLALACCIPSSGLREEYLFTFIQNIIGEALTEDVEVSYQKLVYPTNNNEYFLIFLTPIESSSTVVPATVAEAPHSENTIESRHMVQQIKALGSIRDMGKAKQLSPIQRKKTEPNSSQAIIKPSQPSALSGNAINPIVPHNVTPSVTSNPTDIPTGTTAPKFSTTSPGSSFPKLTTPSSSPTNPLSAQHTPSAEAPSAKPELQFPSWMESEGEGELSDSLPISRMTTAKRDMPPGIPQTFAVPSNQEAAFTNNFLSSNEEPQQRILRKPSESQPPPPQPAIEASSPPSNPATSKEGLSEWDTFVMGLDSELKESGNVANSPGGKQAGTRKLTINPNVTTRPATSALPKVSPAVPSAIPPVISPPISSVAPPPVPPAYINISQNQNAPAFSEWEEFLGGLESEVGLVQTSEAAHKTIMSDISQLDMQSQEATPPTHITEEISPPIREESKPDAKIFQGRGAIMTSEDMISENATNPIQDQSSSANTGVSSSAIGKKYSQTRRLKILQPPNNIVTSPNTPPHINTPSTPVAGMGNPPVSPSLPPPPSSFSSLNAPKTPWLLPNASGMAVTPNLHMDSSYSPPFTPATHPAIAPANPQTPQNVIFSKENIASNAGAALRLSFSSGNPSNNAISPDVIQPPFITSNNAYSDSGTVMPSGPNILEATKPKETLARSLPLAEKRPILHKFPLNKPPAATPIPPVKEQEVPKRHWMRIMLILLCIPLFIIAGLYIWYLNGGEPYLQPYLTQLRNWYQDWFGDPLLLQYEKILSQITSNPQQLGEHVQALDRLLQHPSASNSPLYNTIQQKRIEIIQQIKKQWPSEIEAPLAIARFQQVYHTLNRYNTIPELKEECQRSQAQLQINASKAAQQTIRTTTDLIAQNKLQEAAQAFDADYQMQIPQVQQQEFQKVAGKLLKPYVQKALQEGRYSEYAKNLANFLANPADHSGWRTEDYLIVLIIRHINAYTVKNNYETASKWLNFYESIATTPKVAAWLAQLKDDIQLEQKWWQQLYSGMAQLQKKQIMIQWEKTGNKPIRGRIVSVKQNRLEIVSGNQRWNCYPRDLTMATLRLITESSPSPQLQNIQDIEYAIGVYMLSQKNWVKAKEAFQKVNRFSEEKLKYYQEDF